MVYAYLIDRQETVNRIKIVENKTHIEEEFDLRPILDQDRS